MFVEGGTLWGKSLIRSDKGSHKIGFLSYVVGFFQLVEFLQDLGTCLGFNHLLQCNRERSTIQNSHLIGFLQLIEFLQNLDTLLGNHLFQSNKENNWIFLNGTISSGFLLDNPLFHSDKGHTIIQNRFDDAIEFFQICSIIFANPRQLSTLFLVDPLFCLDKGQTNIKYTLQVLVGFRYFLPSSF